MHDLPELSNKIALCHVATERIHRDIRRPWNPGVDFRLPLSSLGRRVLSVIPDVTKR